MAFSYSSLDVSQRSSLKWLLWPKRQIHAELYKQLPFGNDLKKKYKDIHLISIFTPQIQERWLWYWFSNPLLSMLIDQITLRFLLQFHIRHFQQWAIPVKIQTWPRIEYMEFPLQVYLRKSTWKYQSLIKKQLELLEGRGGARVLKKDRYETSPGLGFWPWNFQGVAHNFAEFTEVKACFLRNF